MSTYTVSGITVATAATDAHGIFSVWNPHASRAIRLREIGLVATVAPAAGAGFRLRRSTTRGTAGSTITPAAVHAFGNDGAPPSGFLVEIGPFTSGQPTLTSGNLGPSWVLSAVAASGIIYPVPHPWIEIPPGGGIVVVNRAAIAVVALEFYVVVDD